MTGMRLTSALPIDSAIIDLSLDTYGWRLIVRHRHQGGLYSDCSIDHFTDLGLDEALDVIASVMHTTCQQ